MIKFAWYVLIVEPKNRARKGGGRKKGGRGSRTIEER